MLTRKEIQNIVRGKGVKGQRFEFSTNEKGLNIVIQKGGSLSWTTRYQLDGINRNVTLGSVDLKVRKDHTSKPVIGGHLSPDEAETLWRQLRNEVKAGKDIAPRRNDPSLVDQGFAVQARLYVESVLRKEKSNRTWREQASTLGWRFSTEGEPTLIDHGLAEKWQGKRVGDITKKQIIAEIDRARYKGIPGRDSRGEDSLSRAYDLFTQLNGLFKWLAGRDVIDLNPMVSVLRPALYQSRDRVLEDDELQSVWEATYSINPVMGAFVRFLAITGQRRNEVAEMKWTEIKGTTWTIPASRSKNGKATDVHLPPFALQQLRGLKRVGTFVFSTDGERHFSGFSKLKIRLDELSGVTDWRLHDLRRTFATGLQKLGTPLQVTEAALNHISGSKKGVAAIYLRHDYKDEKAAAVTAWADYVQNLVGEPQDTVSDNLIDHPRKTGTGSYAKTLERGRGAS